MDRLDLVALRRPVEVVLPDGSVHTIAPFRGPGIALLRQWEREEDPLIRAGCLSELLQLALPTATEEQLDDTGPEDWSRIVASAAGKAEIVEAVLKNVPSGGVPETPPPSSAVSNTTTTSPASSPA